MVKHSGQFVNINKRRCIMRRLLLFPGLTPFAHRHAVGLVSRPVGVRLLRYAQCRRTSVVPPSPVRVNHCRRHLAACIVAPFGSSAAVRLRYAYGAPCTAECCRL